MCEQRLIDANALPMYKVKIVHSFGIVEGSVVFPDDIKKAPTIDAVPVVHSSWGYRAYRSDARITVSGEAVCRKCHAPFFRVRGHWFKYCPNCGAKMDAKDMDVPTKDGGASDGSD